MKIIALNHDSNDVEIYHITDEYTKWCIDHNVGDEDYEEPELFNDFMSDFFRDLGYGSAEFMPFIVAEDDEPVRIIEVYPDEHIEHII